MTPELLARAEAAGLTRGRAWWGRPVGGVKAIVWEHSAQWWWAPETSPHSRDGFRAFDDEADALSAALDWIEAGEPAVEVAP